MALDPPLNSHSTGTPAYMYPPHEKTVVVIRKMQISNDLPVYTSATWPYPIAFSIPRCLFSK